jgi:hypothetical protein
MLLSSRFRRYAGVLSVVLFAACCSSVDAATIANGSFETPVLSDGAFVYNPTGAGWTFSNFSGIVNYAPGAPGFAASAPPPDGDQFALLQFGSFSQLIDFGSGGLFHLSFFDAGRVAGATYGGNAEYAITLDGLQIGGGSTTSGQAFTFHSLDITVLAGSHTLAFTTVPLPGDNTAFFDDITFGPRTVPEPGTLALLAGAMGCALIMRRRRGA